MKKLLDLKLFGLVVILTVALVFIGVEFIEGQVRTLGKPDKPGKPSITETEWISFMGDLLGGQEVESCCPNAGPWPDYTMTLPFGVVGIPAGTYDGQMFINYYGVGRNQKYIVQFWNDDIAIEIIGGDILEDRKNKVTVVTFVGEMCWDIRNPNDRIELGVVDFTLQRARLKGLHTDLPL